MAEMKLTGFEAQGGFWWEGMEKCTDMVTSFTARADDKTTGGRESGAGGGDNKDTNQQEL